MPHVEDRAGVHTRAQRAPGIGHLHLDLERAGRGVERRIDQRNGTRKGLVGEDVHLQLDGHPDLHVGEILLGNIGDDLQRVDLHDVQDGLRREEVARLVVARRDHACDGRTHLDVLLEVGDHLALHVQLRLGLLDLLRRDTAGLIDGQQAVVIVLDGLQLHELLGVLRRVERHDELPLVHGVAHLDQDAVDVHARSRRSDVVLPEGLDLRSELLGKLHGGGLRRFGFGQHTVVLLHVACPVFAFAAGEGGRGKQYNCCFLHMLSLFFNFHAIFPCRRCGRTRPWPSGNRRSPANS